LLKLCASARLFSRSIKTICRSFFCSLRLCISCLIKKIASIVDVPGIKPNWFLVMLVTPLKRCSMILSHSFIVWLISLILRKEYCTLVWALLWIMILRKEWCEILNCTSLVLRELDQDTFFIELYLTMS
jgi:hypothetical protein